MSNKSQSLNVKLTCSSPNVLADQFARVSSSKTASFITTRSAPLESGSSSLEMIVQTVCLPAFISSLNFLIKKEELSQKEILLQEISDEIESQMRIEDDTEIELPSEINGYGLLWSTKREYLTPQIFILESVSFILIVVLSKRKKQEEEKKRIQDMERDYADIVSQLALLYGAGMTTKQAWNRIAVQYSFKKKAQMIPERAVYEAILRMNGRFLEGVSERAAYQQFKEEIPASCYYKLMRILLGSMEKGTQGLAVRLEEESRLAFEQNILQAKKRGEEASTKMLGPLMFMLVLVMGIIMIPALMGFQI